MTENAKDFKSWYEQNKEAYNKQRASKWANDAAYRERQKQYKRAALLPDPEFGRSLTEMAQALDIGLWVLLGWIERGYLPQPLEYKGRKWINQKNYPALVSLRDFFVVNGKKAAKSKPEGLLDLTNLIHSNWVYLEKPNAGKNSEASD